MRVVMFGFQTWGRKTLQALIHSHHDVVLVVTHPDSKTTYKAMWSDSVADLAAQYGIPVHRTDRADPATIDLVSRAKPEVIVVNSWYSWLPPQLYELPPHGTLNLHDSLLPKFAGFSPMLWALISGATETGVTVHRMDAGLDTGDILVQQRIPIEPDVTGTELVLAGMELIPKVLDEALGALENGTAVWRPQNSAERSYFHKRSQRDSLIDFTWPAADLERFVRALSHPYPRAFSFYRGQRLEILSARVCDFPVGGTPGRVVALADGAAVVCGPAAFRGRNRALLITTVRTPDSTEHDAAKFFTRGGYLTATPAQPDMT